MDTLIDIASNTEAYVEADAFEAEVSGLQHNGWMTMEGYLMALGLSHDDFKPAKDL